MNVRTLAVLGVCGAMGFGLSGCKNKKDAVKESLAQAGYELTPEAYFRAAESDDTLAMEKMIKGGVPLECRNNTDDTALHAAAVAGMKKSVKFLLDRRLAVDVLGNKGRTPLMAAVIYGKPDMVRYLLKMGANPMLKDADGYRPLMLAVMEGRPDMIGELAVYDREDLDSALLAAVLLGKVKEIDQLSNYGASVYARMDDGRTALMVAAENDHKDAVKLLVEIGANRFAMDENGKIAADYAREAGHEELALYLANPPTDDEFKIEEPDIAGNAIERRLDAAISAEHGGSVSSNAGGSNAGRPQAEATSPVRREPATSLAGQELGKEVAGAPIAYATADEDEEGPSAPRDSSPVPLIMRGYRQKELPVRVESVTGKTAYLRVAGRAPVAFSEGADVPGSSLKVVRIQKKMRSTKENEGVPLDVSVVEVEDTRTGRRREFQTGNAATSDDPVALVEDAATGKRYVARTGQEFKGADGTLFRVADVRPNQMVVENSASGEVWTVPLRGPRG